MRWRYFWTIVASVAGVIGAAAAVFPLLTAEQLAVHLSYDQELDGLRVETLSEPVILTGKWYISRGRWWNSNSLQTGDILGEPFNGKRIAANDRRTLYVNKRTLEVWAGTTSDCPPRHDFCDRPRQLITCPSDDREFEIGLEAKSRFGTQWARMNLPYCIKTNAKTAQPQKPFRWDEKRGLVND